MKSSLEIREKDTIKNQIISIYNNQDNATVDLNKIDCLNEILTSEGNESFKNYIEWLGLSLDPKLLVLSSIHHYYYDAEEMKNISTVVNLKELNQIKEIDNFFKLISQILPPKCYLIGCFVDNKKHNGFVLRYSSSDYQSKKRSVEINNGIVSKIPFLNRIFSIMDLKTSKYLSGKDVSILLKKSGFKLIDMTELEELTYFCAQSLSRSDSE
jgi:hypothetical protein